MNNIKPFGKHFNFTVSAIILFLILGILADFIDKIDILYQLNLPKTNKYLKLFFLVYSLLAVAIYKFEDKSIKHKLIFIPACFFFVFFIKAYYISEIPALVKNFFLIGTVPFFYIVKNQNLIKLQSYLLPVLKVITGINFLAILVGLIFDFQLFHTYSGNRFGFNGLLLNQVQPTYFYTSLLFVFYKKSNIFLLICIFCGLVLGTKAFYGVFFLFSFIVAYDILKENSLANKKKAIAIVSISSIIALLALYLLLSSNLFSNIIFEKGLVTAFFSYRNIYLLEIINGLNSDNFNLLFGTISLPDYRSEFSFIDIVLFLGVLGLIFYVIMLKNIFRIFVNNRIGKSYFILILLIACFSGNFFSFPFNGFMFMLTLLYLYTDTNRVLLTGIN
tara:strand:- start:259 stop:1425 length:1167 start_codon:yes stop_codon:yes gene_type:complete